MPIGIPQKKIRSDVTDGNANYALREARIAAGYTLSRVGKEAGVSGNEIDAYERLRRAPSLERAGRIGRLFGRDAGEIFPRHAGYLVREIRAEKRSGNRLDSYGTAKNPLPLEKVPKKELSRNYHVDGIPYEMLKDRINTVLGTLRPKERMVVKLIFGIGGEHAHTLEEVSKLLHVTSPAVWQQKDKAIRRLRHPSRARRLEGFLGVSVI